MIIYKYINKVMNKPKDKYLTEGVIVYEGKKYCGVCGGEVKLSKTKRLYCSNICWKDALFKR